MATSASFSAPGTYILRLTVSDGAQSASDDVQILVSGSGGNRPPIAVDDQLTVPGEPFHSGSSQPQVLDPGFRLERFATVKLPLALAVPPANSPFGNNLYVASTDLGFLPGAVRDIIYKVDLNTRTAGHFFELPDESDPLSLKFGPGASYTNNLYISSNNRDSLAGLSDGADNGGSIVFLEPNPVLKGEQFLTAKPPPGALSEPASMAFSANSAFGTNLYVVNSTDPPFAIMKVASTGAPSLFAPAIASMPFIGLAFAVGNGFGTNLYSSLHPDKLGIVDAAGGFAQFTSIPSIDRVGSVAFAPHSSFGKAAYVSGRKSNQSTPRISLFRVEATGTVAEFASGFKGSLDPRIGGVPAVDSLAFSNDGVSLFVADHESNAIFRIFAKASPEGNVLTNDSDPDGDSLTAILNTPLQTER